MSAPRCARCYRKIYGTQAVHNIVDCHMNTEPEPVASRRKQSPTQPRTKHLCACGYTQGHGGTCHND